MNLRSAAVRILTGAVAIATLAVSPALAGNDVTVDRLAGTSRIDTAVTVVDDAFGDTVAVPRIYLATAEAFPDALAAGSAAAAYRSPVLLTGRTELPDRVAATIDRLRPAEIVIVGGTAAISNDVVADLRRDNPDRPVFRIAGDSRFATAAQLATDTYDGRTVDIAYLATGDTFADALAGAAAAGRDGAPLLLASSPSDSRPNPDLPDATSDALAQLRPRTVVVLGGTGVIGQAAADQAGRAANATVTRIAGDSRFETAVELSRSQFATTGTVYLTTGRNFPDALAGAAAAVEAGASVLLTEPDALPDATAFEIARLGPSRIVVLGGTAAVSDRAADRAGHAARSGR